MANPFKKRFIPVTRFTDRYELRDMLVNATLKPQYYQEYRIKMIYGPGGFGKSALSRDFFIPWLKQQDHPVKLIWSDAIDFELDNTRKQPEDALLSVARDMIERGKVPLPAFTIGILKYKSLSATTKNFKEAYPYLFKLPKLSPTGDKVVNDALLEIIDDASKEFTNAMEYSIPLVGYILKKLSIKAKDNFFAWLNKTGAGEIISDLDTLNRVQLLDRLPVLLAHDLYRYMESDISANGHPTKRIVIVIDGYETLWEEQKTLNPNKDLWIRQFIRHLPGALVVIFGRERLAWEKIETDEELVASIEHHRIEHLSAADADEYLQAVPIPDPAIRSAIIKNASGGSPESGAIPSALALEVESFSNIRNSGREPAPSHFTGEHSQNAVLGRLFTHLPLSQSDAIKALSVSRYIDNDILRVFEREQLVAPGAVSLAVLKEFSFTTSEQHELTIHEIVRKYAAEQYLKINLPGFIRAHKTLFGFFDNKLPGPEPAEITPAIEHTIELAAFHKKHFDADGLPDWLIGRVSSLSGYELYETCTSLLDEAFTILEKKWYSLPVDGRFESNVAQQIARLKFVQARRHLQNGKFLHAESSIIEALEVLDIHGYGGRTADLKPDTFNDKKRAELELKTEVLQLAAQIKLECDRLADSADYFHRAKTFAALIGYPLNELPFAGYLRQIGEVRLAEDIYERLLLSHITQNHFREASFCANALAELLSEQRRFNEAIHFHEMAISYDKNDQLPHYSSPFLLISYCRTLLLTDNPDHANVDQRLAEAEEICRYTRRKDDIAYGLLWAARCISAAQLGKWNHATGYWEQAKAIFTKEKGGESKAQLELDILFSFYIDQTPLRGESNASYQSALDHVVNVVTGDFNTLTTTLALDSTYMKAALGVVKRFLSRTGDQQMLSRVTKNELEIERLARHQTFIRLEGFLPDTDFSAAQQDELALRIRKVSSIPDSDYCQMEVYKVPFLQTHLLARVYFTETTCAFAKYFFFNTEEILFVDTRNETLSTLVHRKLVQIDENNLWSYVLFFNDASVSRHGRKSFVLRDATDLPWKLNSSFTALIKPFASELIPPASMSRTESGDFRIEFAVLFDNQIHISSTIVTPDGDLTNESSDSGPLELLRFADGSFAVRSDNDDYTNIIQVLRTWPAHVDRLIKDVRTTDNLIDRMLRMFADIQLSLPVLRKLEMQEEQSQKLEDMQRTSLEVVNEFQMSNEYDPALITNVISEYHFLVTEICAPLMAAKKIDLATCNRFASESMMAWEIYLEAVDMLTMLNERKQEIRATRNN